MFVAFQRQNHIIFLTDSDKGSGPSGADSSSNSAVQTNSKSSDFTLTHREQANSAAPSGGVVLRDVGGGETGDENRGSDEDGSEQEEEELHALQADVVRQLPALTDEALCKAVPADKNGEPSSIGSAFHYSGQCHPCLFNDHLEGCKTGIRCLFCHFAHSKVKRKGKRRPCKGKRDRYRKLVSVSMDRIDQDPEAFDVQQMELPPSIANNASLRKKITARLEMHKETVVASGRPGEDEDELPGSATASLQYRTALGPCSAAPQVAPKVPKGMAKLGLQSPTSRADAIALIGGPTGQVIGSRADAYSDKVAGGPRKPGLISL